MQRCMHIHTAHYVVRTHGDRWCVAHATPGLPGSYTIDVDCLTLASAEHEAAWLEADRDRTLQRERQEAMLLGQREPSHFGARA